MNFLPKSCTTGKSVLLLVALLSTFQIIWVQRLYGNITCIQEVLSNTVFNPGPIDGAWGKKTETAVKDYFNYMGIKVNFPITKQNSQNICSEIQSHDTKKPNLSYRKFHIEINKSDLENFLGRKLFDFEKYDLALNVSDQDCSFRIFRKVHHDGRQEMLASGTLDIYKGNIVFRKNYWETGGIADSSYLEEQASIALLKDKSLVGAMPYFPFFVDPGEIAEPPITIEFDKVKKGGNDFVHTFKFDVDDWASGIISISGCDALSS